MASESLLLVNKDRDGHETMKQGVKLIASADGILVYFSEVNQDVDLADNGSTPLIMWRNCAYIESLYLVVNEDQLLWFRGSES